MYFCTGYYLISPKHELCTVNGHTFTSRSWSVSTLISYVYPDPFWGLSWCYSKRQFAKDYPNFQPTPITLTAIQAWVENEYKVGNYGWPGFFTSLEEATEFRSLFLASLPQVQSLGLFLDEQFYSAALAQIQAQDSVAIDLYQLLQRRLPEPDHGTEIGFDLLGIIDYGGYEPFSYHVLETEYQQRFDVELNEYGLFANQSECLLVADYTDQEADEPAVWLPFKVKLFA